MKCPRCGNDSYYGGTCQRCEAEIKHQRQVEDGQREANRLQQRQLDVLREQAEAADDARYQQEMEADLIRNEQEEAQSRLLQSQCHHEFVATAFQKPDRLEPPPQEATPLDLGRAKSFAEEHFWSGKCRICGLAMSRHQRDTCSHHWTADYYLAKPGGQCCFCGEIRAGAQALIDRELDPLMKEYRRKVEQQEKERKQKEAMQGIGCLVVVIIAVIAAFAWFQDNREKARIAAEQQQKVEAEQERADEAQSRAEEDMKAAAEQRQRERDELRAQAQSFRTWTDVNGRQVTAVYAGSSGTTVWLRARDGTQGTFAKSSLSSQDQALLRRLDEAGIQ
jgi:hypothetical protein